MDRRFGLAILCLVVLGCGRGGCASEPKAAVRRIEGKVVGSPAHVVLWETEAGRRTSHVPSADGAYAFDFTGDLEKARIQVEAHDSDRNGPVTTSGPLGIGVVATQTTIAVPTLGTWNVRPAIQREGKKVRFVWPAFEGLPAQKRYSLRLSYTAIEKDGERRLADASLITKGELEAVQTLEELAEVMPDRDPAVKEIQVAVKVYDPGDPVGPMWATEQITWPVPDDLPVLAGAGR